MLQYLKITALLNGDAAFRALMGDLKKGLSEYLDAASLVLNGSGISVKTPPPDYFSVEKNFFSIIFLYSYYRAGVSPERRAFYAAVNQCLRGMVTGCDNLLDDEYKKTLDTDLPEGAWKFRSIVDIMASDRVLFKLLLSRAASGDLSLEKAGEASAETLRALALSGAQEATEEGGVKGILKPEEVLSQAHHYKTGLLFKAPWAVPMVIEEDLDDALASRVRESLYGIGMGCQIMDDMVDMARDLKQSRHNYAVSFAFHEGGHVEKQAIEAALSKGFPSDESLLLEFPRTAKHCSSLSFEYLDRGLSNLLAPEHASLKEACIGFLSERIGAARLLKGAR